MKRTCFTNTEKLFLSVLIVQQASKGLKRHLRALVSLMSGKLATTGRNAACWKTRDGQGFSCILTLTACRFSGEEGYTIREACILARSTQPALRSAACKLIAAVARKVQPKWPFALPTLPDANQAGQPVANRATQVNFSLIFIQVLSHSAKLQASQMRDSTSSGCKLLVLTLEWLLRCLWHKWGSWTVRTLTGAAHFGEDLPIDNYCKSSAAGSLIDWWCFCSLTAQLSPRMRRYGDMCWKMVELQRLWG